MKPSRDITPLGQAVARHPSAGWQPDLDSVRARLAARLEGEGHSRPVEAATALVVRGRLGLDRARFAVLMGMAEAEVATAEEGGPSSEPQAKAGMTSSVRRRNES